MIASIAAKKNSAIDMVNEFRALADLFSDLCEKHGITVRPYFGSSLPVFSDLSNVRQQDILGHFRAYVDVAIEIDREGESIANSPLFLLRMLKKLGMQTPMDVFDKLKENSIVEMYDMRNVQVFRNLNFFKVCSYTLEELMSREWWQLYERAPHDTQEIFLYVSRILSKEITSTCDPGIPTHPLKEKESARRYEMNYTCDYLSPLMVGSDVVGVLAVEHCEVYKSRSERVHGFFLNPC